MIQPLSRCPLCGELMSPQRAPDDTAYLDCPFGHSHSITKARQLAAGATAPTAPQDPRTCEHHWTRIQRSEGMAVEECVYCDSWRLAEP